MLPCQETRLQARQKAPQKSKKLVYGNYILSSEFCEFKLKFKLNGGDSHLSILFSPTIATSFLPLNQYSLISFNPRKSLSIQLALLSTPWDYS